LQVTFESSAPAEVQVPFPHLDMCLQPTDWMSAPATASNSTARVLDASDGRTGQVLAVRGTGRVSWAVQLNTTGHSTCQTFRADPWSIDPDPQDTTVDVRVAEGTVSAASLLVRWVRDGCGDATLYDGTPPSGSWSRLEGRTVPAGCDLGSL
jgi:hypothetical protein